MAVQAQYGGGMAAGMCLPDHEVEAQMRELGAMFSAAGGGCYNGGGGGGGYDCAAVVSGAAQSELTCNNGGVCGGAVGMGVGAGRKREREVVEQYAAVASSAALLPIPGMMKVAAPVSRLVESGMTSTSGRSAAAVGDALVSELCAQSAEIDAVVRMERASPSWTRAPSASPPRTPPSTSPSTDRTPSSSSPSISLTPDE
ncbi:hypothetical protein EE612_055994 [Oryza sativa]|nr:hypothetical protein EE612_055994 [Oryza sativa]